MMHGRTRPPGGWLLALAAVGVYVIYGVFAAAFVTVAIILTLHPSETLRIAIWLILAAPFGLLAMRSRSRDWYDWLIRGRPRPDSN
jgi:hypothetical protein